MSKNKKLGVQGEVKTPYGGKQAVYEMFQHLDEAHRNKLLAEIKIKDPAFAQEILHNLFTFSDLEFLQPQALLLISRSVPENKLALALRGAPEVLLLKLTQSMPQRTAQSLKELIQNMGPQAKKSILEAQAEIMVQAKVLESQGKLLLRKTLE